MKPPIGALVVKALAVVAAVVLGFFILAPIFAKPKPGPTGFVFDSSLRPIAFKPMVVRWGGEAYSVTTDARGGFDRPSGVSGVPSVDGYPLIYRMHHSGGRPDTTYHFGPVGVTIFRLWDEAGKPLDTTFDVAFYNTSHPTLYEGNHGRLTLTGVGLAEPDSHIYVTTANECLRLVGWKRTASASTVTYDWTFHKTEGPVMPNGGWTYPSGRNNQ